MRIRVRTRDDDGSALARGATVPWVPTECYDLRLARPLEIH